MRKHRSEPNRKQITDLLSEGLSVKEVANRLGYAKSAFSVLYRHMSHLGIALPGSVQDQLRKTVNLSGIQREFTVGTLLGDGSIPALHGRQQNYLLSFSHSSKYTDYMKWKAEFMYPLGRKITPVTVGKHNALTFQTITHTNFAEYRGMFYPSGIKSIPSNIGDLLTAFGLAVWYMDDGTYYRWHTGRGGYCIFCSESFTLADSELLASVLKKKFSIDVRYRKVKSGTGVRLFLDRLNSEHFAKIVRPHFHHSLLYKLPT